MINESVNYTIQDFRIKTRSVASYSMPSHHFHSSYEIYYMNSGSRDYFLSDTTYRVKQGNLVFIKPHDLHKTMDTGERHSRILISFKLDFLPFKGVDKFIDTCFKESKVVELTYSMQDRVEEMLRLIIIEADEKGPFFEAKLQGLMTNFLIEVARYIQSDKDQKKTEPAVNQKVYEVIHYLKDNFDQTITLDQLADDFYISRYYLTRVFKKTTGFTIFEFIHSLRVVEAQKLLRETNKKVIDIAEKVGFTNVSNFGKVFKSVTGMSPLHYRKNHLIDD